MYDPSLQWGVLRLLEHWGRLPLSDVLALLDPLQRPLFRDDLIKDMAWDGLIALQSAGDEQVLELTPRGRAALDEQRPPTAPRES